MSTNSLISIIKDGKVIVKIIAGCEGKNAEQAAKEITRFMLIDCDPTNLEDINSIVHHSNLGCDECLVIMNDAEILYKGKDDFPYKYREKFEDPEFNPRLPNGGTPYLFIIPAL